MTYMKKLRVLPHRDVKGTSVSENLSIAESDEMQRKWGHGCLTNVPFIFFIIPLQNEVVSELRGRPVEHRLGPCFPAEAMIAGT